MIRRLWFLLFFVPLPSSAQASRECEVETRSGCSWQVCLQGPDAAYPRPTLSFSPAPGVTPVALRVHLHGWTQDEGRPRNPKVDFPWPDPQRNPVLAELRPFLDAYEFASAACGADPEWVVLPLSRGHNDDHQAHLLKPGRFAAYVAGLRAERRARGESEPRESSLRISAHSGAGRIVARLLPGLEFPVSRIKLLDATYHAEDLPVFAGWLSETPAPEEPAARLLDVVNVSRATAAVAGKLVLPGATEIEESETVRWKTLPGGRFRNEADLSGKWNHYSVVAARWKNRSWPTRRILVVGDSHTAGTFGKTLDRLLRKNPDPGVRTEASCGSIIRWWYTGQPTSCGYLQIDENAEKTELLKSPTPRISSLLSMRKPDFVIVALGANYVRGYTETILQEDVGRLLRDLRSSGAACLWVGPPHMRRFEAELDSLVPRLQSLVEPVCRFLDSRRFTSYPAGVGDGVHYESPSLLPIAENWAAEIEREFRKELPGKSLP